MKGEGEGDAMLMAWKIEEGCKSRNVGIHPQETEKVRETDFSFEPSERHTAVSTP